MVCAKNLCSFLTVCFSLTCCLAHPSPVLSSTATHPLWLSVMSNGQTSAGPSQEVQSQLFNVAALLPAKMSSSKITISCWEAMRRFPGTSVPMWGVRLDLRVINYNKLSFVRIPSFTYLTMHMASEHFRMRGQGGWELGRWDGPLARSGWPPYYERSQRISHCSYTLVCPMIRFMKQEWPSTYSKVTE